MVPAVDFWRGLQGGVLLCLTVKALRRFYIDLAEVSQRRVTPISKSATQRRGILHIETARGPGNTLLRTHVAVGGGTDSCAV